MYGNSREDYSKHFDHPIPPSSLDISQDLVHLIYFYEYNNTFHKAHFVEIGHNKLCYSLKPLIF